MNKNLLNNKELNERIEVIKQGFIITITITLYGIETIVVRVSSKVSDEVVGRHGEAVQNSSGDTQQTQ